MRAAVIRSGEDVMGFIKWFVLLLVLLSPAAQAVQEVRIGVLSFRPLEQARQQWQATGDLLNARIPGYRFTLEVLFFPDMDQAMAAGRFDFVLTNPEHYIALRARYGLSAIATLMPLAEGHPVSQFGGVIFTRADRADIDELADLRGKVVSSVQDKSFGAYMMQRWTLYKHGIAIGEIGRMRFTGMPQDNAVRDVLSGEADVGFVRTGLLERMAREGKLELDQIKVINRQPADSFPQALSTDLYPEWAFSAMPRVPERLKKQVAQALFNIDSADKAARTGNYFGFSPPGNYAPVEAVMTRLRMMPDQTVEFDLRDILNKYLKELMTAALLVLGLALWGGRPSGAHQPSPAYQFPRTRASGRRAADRQCHPGEQGGGTHARIEKERDPLPPDVRAPFLAHAADRPGERRHRGCEPGRRRLLRLSGRTHACHGHRPDQHDDAGADRT